MNKRVKYYLSLFASLASMFGALACLVSALINLTKGNTVAMIASGIGAVACLVLYKSMFSVRTNARDELDFDERGNKKGNEYKNLSAKDKKQIDLQILAENERIISSGELKKITFKGSSSPDEELNKLIGLTNIKEEVLRIKAKMEYDRKYRKKNTSAPVGNHMCFLGSPGTGKTTVARIMAGILFKYKCIKENKYIEVDAAFLKGATPDLTLKRVKAILHHAKGGVLFIDEAYSLMNGVNAAEIIAELVKYMEDNKKDFVLILAGYQGDMRRLIDSNPGLHSRVGKYLHFQDYNIAELKDIFTAVANEAGYCVDDSAYERFEMAIMKERSTKNFGNARSVRNLFQRALDLHAYNVMNNVISKDKVYVITGADIQLTAE